MTHLPAALRAVAHFSDTPQAYPARGYAAPVGAARLAAPDASVSRQGRDVTLTLNAPGDGVALTIPREAQLISLDIAGVAAQAQGQVEDITCNTPDCGRMQMILHLGTSAPFEIVLRAITRGLPAEAGKLAGARPPEAVPSQGGDVTVLIRKSPSPGDERKRRQISTASFANSAFS